MANYAVVAGIVVTLLGLLWLVWAYVGAAVVKCGICGNRQRLRASRKQTFTCRRCKKTLPRRLAYRVGG
ncbi:MAG: hypothetical protein K0U69_10150 [Actinomycetia bacterium]|nr:hypothetical protein [Actinomycetes bacterium]MCH9709857.1 hypothetical protein [Actinomycetes bacterium]MCH9736125.1 hypothetical protein [Actinomycetes bacterium]